MVSGRNPQDIIPQDKIPQYGKWKEAHNMKEGENAIAVNMEWQKCGTFSSFRWLSPDIYHINILRNPNEVDVHWGRSAKPKYIRRILNEK